MSSPRKAPLFITLGVAIATAVGAGVAAKQAQSDTAQPQTTLNQPTSKELAQTEEKAGDENVNGQEQGQTSSEAMTNTATDNDAIAAAPQDTTPNLKNSADKSEQPTAQQPPSQPVSASIAAPEVYLSLARQDQQQAGEPFTPQPVLVKDEAVAGSNFAEVKAKMRRIVRDRDAQALRDIADPNINLTFGRPVTLDYLEIDDPDALVWKQLERTFDAGCATDTPEPPYAYWACPPAFLATGIAPQLDPYESIIITGSDVAVRQLPSLDSPVLARVSNVALKSGGYISSEPNALSESEQQQLDDWYRSSSTNQGWQYVQLGDGRKGFVSSRYAFSPIGYRAVFNQTDSGEWSMTAFIAGD